MPMMPVQYTPDCRVLMEYDICTSKIFAAECFAIQLIEYTITLILYTIIVYSHSMDFAILKINSKTYTYSLLWCTYCVSFCFLNMSSVTFPKQLVAIVKLCTVNDNKNDLSCVTVSFYPHQASWKMCLTT